MDRNRDYYEQRERIERAAAKSAADFRARRAHQELAEGYAALARNETHLTERGQDRQGPLHFTILGSGLGI